MSVLRLSTGWQQKVALVSSSLCCHGTNPITHDLSSPAGALMEATLAGLKRKRLKLLIRLLL